MKSFWFISAALNHCFHIDPSKLTDETKQWKQTRKSGYAQYLQDRGSSVVPWLAVLQHFQVLHLHPPLCGICPSQNYREQSLPLELPPAFQNIASIPFSKPTCWKWPNPCNHHQSHPPSPHTVIFNTYLFLYQVTWLLRKQRRKQTTTKIKNKTLHEWEDIKLYLG